ncbi:MAG: hypothetical protein ABSD78_14950 [Acidimicrobiales bacterium]|jgi:hypothetical protein
MWTGTAWVLQSSPNPTGATPSYLQGLSCAAVAACAGVGDYCSVPGNVLTLAEAEGGDRSAI